MSVTDDLYKMIMSNTGADKRAFVTPEQMTAAAGGGAPAGPAAMGGAPMDPMAAQMGAAAGVDPSQIPVDPAAMGIPLDPALAAGAPAAGTPAIPPASAGTAPAPGAGPDYDTLVSAFRQVMQETGAGNNGGGNGGGGGGKDMAVRLDNIEGALAQVLERLGMASADQAVSDAVAEVAPVGVGLGPGAGEAAPAGQQGTPMPPAMGPMDPNAGAMMGSIGAANAPGAMPGMQVSAEYQPSGVLRSSLTNPNGSRKIGALISSLRRS
jgi:hypothetical protein